MKLNSKAMALSLSTVVGVALFAGCAASAQDASSTVPSGAADESVVPTREAGQVVDCGYDNILTKQILSIANRTNGELAFKVRDFGCKGWGYTDNPTQFDGAVASSGGEVGPITIMPKHLTQPDQKRPWNFFVTGRAPGGESLSGLMTQRPAYGQVNDACRVVGQSNCKGASLCADDPDNRRVVTTLPMRNDAGVVVTTLNVVTVCTMADHSAVIEVKGTLPSPRI